MELKVTYSRGLEGGLIQTFQYLMDPSCLQQWRSLCLSRDVFCGEVVCDWMHDGTRGHAVTMHSVA